MLASGSTPATLPGLAIDGERVLTSEHALRLGPLPASADRARRRGDRRASSPRAWRSFGVEVTVVEALPRLVADEEPAISAALERAFRKRGITVGHRQPDAELRGHRRRRDG